MTKTSGDRVVLRRPLLPPYLLLLLAEQPGHGYELVERLRIFGFDLSGPGAVYRELRAMEEAGLARSTWSAPTTGPVPRVYELTRAGQRALDEAGEQLADLAELVRSLLERYEALAAAGRRSRRATAVRAAANV
jgi:PadR family transcriptional regulator PadR